MRQGGLERGLGHKWLGRSGDARSLLISGCGALPDPERVTKVHKQEGDDKLAFQKKGGLI